MAPSMDTARHDPPLSPLSTKASKQVNDQSALSGRTPRQAGLPTAAAIVTEAESSHVSAAGILRTAAQHNGVTGETIRCGD